MSDLSRDDRRRNRKHVLDALKAETGSSGGSVAAARVDAYRQNPLSATTGEFTYVGSLILTRFYIDPNKPNQSERRSLWQEITTRMNKVTAKDPGGWDGNTSVAQLQAIVEAA